MRIKRVLQGIEEWTHPGQGAFLFAKTGCYGNSIGVHWVKHDGWGNPAMGMKNLKEVVSLFRQREYDRSFRLLSHQRGDGPRSRY